MSCESGCVVDCVAAPSQNLRKGYYLLARYKLDTLRPRVSLRRTLRTSRNTVALRRAAQRSRTLLVGRRSPSCGLCGLRLKSLQIRPVQYQLTADTAEFLQCACVRRHQPTCQAFGLSPACKCHVRPHLSRDRPRCLPCGGSVRTRRREGTRHLYAQDAACRSGTAAPSRQKKVCWFALNSIPPYRKEL